MSRLLDIVREMVVAVSRLQKRPTEVEISVGTSEPKHVPPSPLPLTQFPHIRSALLAVGMYKMQSPWMLVGVTLPGQSSMDVEMVSPLQFIVGEGVGSQGSDHHVRKHWDVNYFLKNDGQLFYGSTDSEDNC